MGKRFDLVGNRYGRLIVVSRQGSSNGVVRWLCLCDCGVQKEIGGPRLYQGNVRSCGCLLRDVLTERNHKHGQTGTRTHRIWLGMMARCYNPNRPAYPDYGGRGILVCDRWHDFTTFLADMGVAPAGMTIERIDNDQSYVPENCKWDTQKMQARNRRSNHLVTFNGETRCIAEWAELTGIPVHTLKRRILYGTYSIEESLTKSRLPARKSAPRAAG